MKRKQYIAIITFTATLCVLQYVKLSRNVSKCVERLVTQPNQSRISETQTGAESESIPTRKTAPVTDVVQKDTIAVSLGAGDKRMYPTLEECLRLIEDDRQGINRTLIKISDPTSDEDVVQILQRGCQEFKARYQFISDGDEEVLTSEEELNFSIAYTLLVHKNLHQIATLLSAIYRSQHIYCVHADTKSNGIFQKGMAMMNRCFANVFLSSKSESVVYASFSRLDAEVHCMKDLLRVPNNLYNWRYLINLCGQDFPTATNREIVNQLMSMNGRICLSGTTELNENAINRVKYVHEIEKLTTGNASTYIVRQTQKLLDPPPYNLTIAKSMAYAIFTREFLQWALMDSEEGRALYNWTAFTRTPDEHFWATLHIYPKSPGWSKTLNWRGVARGMVWKGTKEEKYCAGYWQHNSCVFGGGAMRWLAEAPQLFINKFDMTYDSLPIRCLRKLIDERTKGNATDVNPKKKPMSL